MGTIPQWLTAGGVLGLFGWFARMQLGNRKLAIEAKQVEIAAEGGLRDHFANEVQSLRNQIIKMSQHHLDREREIDDRWRTLLRESEERHDECVKQREELRREVEEIRERQIGTIRQFITFQREIVRLLPDNMKSPEIIQALENLAPFSDTNIEWKM